MKRIITLVLLAIMTVNIVACDKSFRGGGKNLPAAEPTVDSMQEGSRFSQNSKYSLDKIKLSNTQVGCIMDKSTLEEIIYRFKSK